MESGGQPYDASPRTSDRPARHVGWPVLILVCVAALWIGGFLSVQANPGRWWVRAVCSAGFLWAGGILTVCAIALTAVLACAARMGKLRRKPQGIRAVLAKAEEGTALIEFALVLPIALMLVLIMVQATFLMAGNLCVHYAAFCGARTAVVVIPLNFENGDTMNTPLYTDSEKFRRIERAVLYGLLPICSASNDLADQRIPLQASLQRYFNVCQDPVPYWVSSRLGRMWTYAERYTHVTVAPPALGGSYTENEDIVVSVEHVFYLSVPYARRLFSYDKDGVELDFGPAGTEYGTKIRASCRLPNEGVRDFIDVEYFN